MAVSFWGRAAAVCWLCTYLQPFQPYAPLHCARLAVAVAQSLGLGRSAWDAHSCIMQRHGMLTMRAMLVI
jgi:hypothetical protein